MKPRVRYSKFAHEWHVSNHGGIDWFPTWREAYDFAFTAARVRHVVADTINTMQGVS